MFSIHIQNSRHSSLITIGEWEEEQLNFKFGSTAEVRILSAGFGVGTPEITVNFAAIGSHSAAQATTRAALYARAAQLASTLEDFVQHSDYSIETLGKWAAAADHVDLITR